MTDPLEHRSFPVDDSTLDLMMAAMDNPGGEGSNLFGFLDFMSGIFEGDRGYEVVPGAEDELEAAGIRVNRRPRYHPNDVIEALVAEVRRLRHGGPRVKGRAI